MKSLRENILTLKLREEEFRILFVLDRDGVEGLKDFVIRTEKIYKKHVVKKLYWHSARRGFVLSYLDFRRVKELFKHY